MGYRHSAAEGTAAIEIFPITGRKAANSAASAGLSRAVENSGGAVNLKTLRSRDISRSGDLLLPGAKFLS